MTVDLVQVRAIRLDALIGTDAWERQQRQPIEVDVDCSVETTELLATGNLTHGVDFVLVISRVTNLVKSRHFDLAETLADALAHDLLDHTPSLSVRVSLRKYRTCQNVAGWVGVQVLRSRSPQVSA